MATNGRNSMVEVVKMNDKVTDMLDNAGPLEVWQELALEIIKRTGTIKMTNVSSMVVEACREFGSAEDALAALRNGEMELFKAS
jgi:hypothetical protein